MEYQHDKNKVSMLLIDHEKLGIQKNKLLNSLKDWFYFENNKYQEGKAGPSEDLDDGEESEGEYDLYQMSYVTSLHDATADVNGAARLVGDTNEVVHKKLVGSFNRIKRLYHDSLNKTTQSTSNMSDKNDENNLKIKRFEEELSDLTIE